MDETNESLAAARESGLTVTTPRNILDWTRRG